MMRGYGAFLTGVCICVVAGAADWPTYRGNNQRTGCADGKAGPRTPNVLWVHEAQEHFIASPSTDGNALFVSGLGAFNTPTFHALSLDAKAVRRELWTRRPPALKLPVVCSPAVVDGRVVFGDGMHQTDGATLYCLKADTGVGLWQLPVPGTLVHLESAPAVSGGRVFIGGGAAGVLCVDLSRLTLDGKDVDAATLQAVIDTKWKEMQARYEQDKKKDPDFAIPPSEADLPKPQPKRLWQAGRDKWHVDAPVAAAGDRVLVASAYLDAEKCGDRSVLCLDAADGTVKWRTEFALNPWAGPTIQNNTVFVGCSNIRFEPKDIAKGRGEVVALKLADGAVVWRKSIPGGVISPVAACGDTIVFTATDGRLYALSAADGTQKWTYDAGAAMFAAPAVAGQTVYCGNLKGVVHAVNLSDGAGLWKLDLAAAPMDAPGMIYASPIVHDGRLYVATCNLDAPPGQNRTVVVCIGDK